MKINHGSRLDFTREFYAINVKEDGTLDIKIQKLNIFQRLLRTVFGAYSSTIWNATKSIKLIQSSPEAWKKINETITDPTVFKSVFKCEKIAQDQFPITSALPAKSIPDERPAPTTMSGWKKFGREQLQAQLNEIGLEFKESIEKGDCFFDSFAYLLTKLRGDKQYAAQDIRNDIAHYLKREDIPHDKYKKLLKLNRVDANTYDKYRENIKLSASAVYDPIWGDNLAIQIVCDLYDVHITIHSVLMLETTLFETLEGGQYEDFPYTSAPDQKILVCTKLIDKSFRAKSHDAKTVDIAHIEYGPWAHFLPVIKK